MRTCAVRLVLAAHLLASAAAQDAPIADEDLLLRVSADASSVAFGERFGVTVVRVWSKRLEPEPWNDGILAPLSLGEAAVILREDAEHTEETRRYRARLLQVGDVIVTAPFVRARPIAGGELQLAFADELEFTVRSTLPADDAGGVELPMALLAQPFSWRRWWGGGVAGIGILGAASWFVHRRWTRRAPAVADVPPPAHVVADRRLRELRGRAVAGFAASHAFHVELAEILRHYVAERFSVRVAGRTTQELLDAEATAARLDSGLRRRLDAILPRCDAVKYAHHEAAPEDCARLVDEVAALVHDTGSGAEIAP